MSNFKLVRLFVVLEEQDNKMCVKVNFLLILLIRYFTFVGVSLEYKLFNTVNFWKEKLY